MMARRLVVMGVSAVGKSTVGAGLAELLSVPFLDGDDFHATQSVKKMSNGQPLDDADRIPWLHACGRALAEAPDGAVLACSALARRYRRILVEEAPDTTFIHLAADIGRIAARAASRSGHFMNPSLLKSQFDVLEPLHSDENGIVVDADNEVVAILRDIVVGLEASSERYTRPRALEARRTDRR